MEAASKPIYVISGPTASGKTALGVRLARRVGGEVVNFDSVQLYRGIQIATAKPSERTMILNARVFTPFSRCPPIR